MPKKLVILAGGGTGGHVYPLLAVSKELKKKAPEVEFIYFGSGLKSEKITVLNSRIPYKKILCGKFRRYFSIISFLNNLVDFFLFIFGIFQTIYLVGVLKPAVIFSKGGYVSLPTVLAGAIWRVPIISHESDLMPGLANRISTHFARRLAVAFPLKAYRSEVRLKAFYAGLPLRSEFNRYYSNLSKTNDYILVIGGSSGSLEINEMVFSLIDKIIKIKKVIHITGRFGFDKAKKVKSNLPENLKKKYKIIDYSENMDELISSSALVISRAGATSIFEIAACHKKAIFVPISPKVTAHQLTNAQYLKSQNLAEIHLPTESKTSLLNKIQKLVLEKEETRLSQIYFPFSGEILAQAILDELDLREFRKVKKIFLIGIGGVSMKGIAQYLRSMKKKVVGSDLRAAGHSKENITADLDLVVYSSAAGPNSLAKDEHEQAKKLRIPVIRRSEMIALLMRGHTGISISGMHGKTTISTLIARIFDATVSGPSYLIGADSTNFNKTYQFGHGEHFVAEACEYDDAFLSLPTSVAVISNIEEEHLDYFKGGLKQIKDHFSLFIKNIYPGGCLVFCTDDFNTYDIVRENFDELKRKKITVLSYGFKPTADFSISRYNSIDSQISFEIKHSNVKYDFQTKVPGKHFALNCAAAFAVSSYFDLPSLSVQEVFSKYVGVSRRFIKVGEKGKISVFDDYAHHPTEIRATLSGFLDLKIEGRRIVVFQPHQQKRLNSLFRKFVDAFMKSREDILLILPVYKVPGRDEQEEEIHSSIELVKEIESKSNKTVVYAKDYDEALSVIENQAKKGDTILTMGATDVYKIGERFLNKNE